MAGWFGRFSRSSLKHLAVAAASGGAVFLYSTWISQQSAPVLLTGHVRHNQKPVAGATLAFHPTESGTSIRVMTDASGLFTAELPTAGDYSILLANPSTLPLRVFAIRPGSGPVELTIDLPGTSQQVQFVAGDGQPVHELVHVSWEGPLGQPNYTAAGGFLTPKMAGAASFIGWEPGEYQIVGRLESGGAGARRVMIRHDRPGEPVVVTLTRRQGQLRVTDKDGRPLDAKVTIGRTKLDRLQIGVFSLGSVAPGESVVVRALGYETTCKTIGPADWPRAEVRMAPVGRATRVFLQNAPSAIGELRDSASTDPCTVPISQMATTRQVTGQGVHVTLATAATRYDYTLAHLGVRIPLAIDRGESQTLALPPNLDFCLRNPLRVTSLR